MAKTSTAKASAKKAAPARAAAAAQEPVKAAKRASKAAAPAAAKAAPKSKPVAAAKPAAKRAVKAPVKAVAKAGAKPAAKAAKPKAATNVAMKAARKLAVKPVPATRPTIEDNDAYRLVRDSFTMPEQEYALLALVKQACLKAGFDIKKSELLRIGVALISQLDMATLQGVLATLPQLKTGRPRSR